MASVAGSSDRASRVAYDRTVAPTTLRLRGIVFHLAAGGLIALALWVMQDAGGQAAGVQSAPSGLPRGSLVVLAAGFVGGFVYWLLAGRQAGCWRMKAPSPRDTSDPSE